MADLRVTADHRVQLPLPGRLHQVPAVLGQSLIALLRVLAGDPLAAPDLGQGLEELLLVDAVAAEDGGAGGAVLLHQGQVQVLHGDVLVLELLRGLLRVHQELGEAAAGVELVAASGDLGQTVDLPLDIPHQGVHIQPHVGQQPGHQPLPLAQQGQVEVLPLQLLLAVLDGDILAVGDGRLGVLGILIKIHSSCLLAGAPASPPRPWFHFMFIVHPFDAVVKKKISTLMSRVLIFCELAVNFTKGPLPPRAARFRWP